MLRLAIAYESRLGRNDGNPLYVWNDLKKRQARGELEVEHLAPFGDYEAYGKFDAWLDVDWGEDALLDILPYTPVELPHPRIFWCSDSHLGYDWRLKRALKSDVVFCAQKQGALDMKRDGVPNPIWLPHAFEPQAYPKYDLASKIYDVCFVGHVNSQNRLEALDKMFKEFPNFFYGQRLFEDAARKFAESKIVFNISMKDDLNMRTFEAMGSGSFLLTDWNSTIEEFFKDGTHLALYRTEEEMVEKARYYLAHDSEREKIALAGYEEVIKNHRLSQRVDVILSELKKLMEVENACIPVS